MALLNDEILSYVGRSSVKEVACDPVEQGAVRRYSQAIMDDDPIYWDEKAAGARYGGPVAPPIFPIDMFRRDFNTEDPVQTYATDPDFDGVGPPAGQGLPPIEPLRNYAVLYGGSEIEFYKYAERGDRVSVIQRYESITEKTSSKGQPMIFVTIESEYRDQNDQLLVRLHMTTIWRMPNEINATNYGLATGIFTNDVNVGFHAARSLEVGGVHINETCSSRVDLMPYGGVKDSGFGREGPAFSIKELTEERLVTISL